MKKAASELQGIIESQSVELIEKIFDINERGNIVIDKETCRLLKLDTDNSILLIFNKKKGCWRLDVRKYDPSI